MSGEFKPSDETKRAIAEGEAEVAGGHIESLAGVVGRQQQLGAFIESNRGRVLDSIAEGEADVATALSDDTLPLHSLNHYV